MEPLHEALRLIKRQAELESAMRRPGGNTRHRRARAISSPRRTHPVPRRGHCHPGGRLPHAQTRGYDLRGRCGASSTCTTRMAFGHFERLSGIRITV